MLLSRKNLAGLQASRREISEQLNNLTNKIDSLKENINENEQKRMKLREEKFNLERNLEQVEDKIKIRN